MDIRKIRNDFTVLRQKNPPIYMDNSATSLTPDVVIDKMNEYYYEYRANVHRGIHTLSMKASEEYEAAHKKLASFLNTKPENIVATKNTSEATNMVAYGAVKKGDKIVITDIEHHSNLVPWLRLRKKGLIDLNFIKVNREGEIDLDQVKDVTRNANMVSVVHASNVLGSIMPKEVLKIAKDSGALLNIDSAQAAPHMAIDVKKLNCDYLCLSGHKMLGPTGTGALYIRNPDSLEPLMLGGGTIQEVSLQDYQLTRSPDRFECGTPNIAGFIGLGAAADYLKKIGFDNIEKHEKKLVKIVLDELLSEKTFDYYGPLNPEKKVGVIAFNIKGLDAHDVASLLDQKARIMIRSGHHCAMPLHKSLGIAGSARTSLYIYNTEEEVRLFIDTVKKIAGAFGVR